MDYFRDRLETRFEMTGRPQRDVIWEYPLEALREAATNALCHRDYMGTRDTEVRLYDRELLIWNNGGLPANLSIEALKGKHSSIPRNRQIAAAFFYAGLIEQWGGGIEKILAACATAGLPEPLFEEVQGFRVTFKKATAPRRLGPPEGTKSGLSRDQVRVLGLCRTESPLAAILAACDRTNKTKFRESILVPLLSAGLVTPTIPDKPRSRLQKYLITKKGLALLGDTPKATP